MAEERYVQSFDQTKLYATSEGRGTPVYLCDGIGCAGFIWKHLRARLAEHYQVIGWNYRGHGKSQPPQDKKALHVRALCADLRAVMQSFGHERAICLGHSMGVQVILQTALQSPERVLALVPICGSYGQPLQTWHGHDLAARSFAWLRRITASQPALAQRLWRHTLRSRLAYAFACRFEVNGRAVAHADFKPYFDDLSAMDVQIFMQLLHSLQGHSVADELANVAAPTLVVCGERDSFTPSWLSHRMHATIPGAKLLAIADATHIAPLEAPARVASTILQFLQGLGLQDRKIDRCLT